MVDFNYMYNFYFSEDFTHQGVASWGWGWDYYYNDPRKMGING